MDSTAGYGDEERARRIGEIVEAALGAQDPQWGVDKAGVVTVVLDVSAASFHEAVTLAVEQVTAAVSHAGEAFPVDYNRLPQPTHRV